MTPEQVIQLLDQLASRLEGPAKYVFELAVRQTIITGVIEAIKSVIALVLVGITIAITLKMTRSFKAAIGDSKSNWAIMAGSYTPKWDAGDASFASGVTYALAGIIGTFFALIGLSSLTTAVTILLNPEYQTLLNLVGLVK